MKGFLNFLLICFFLLSTSDSFPLCTDLRAPFTLKTPLAFCQYNGSSCCNSTRDLQLKKEFESMNISDENCASAVKSVLCTKCNQFAAALYKVQSAPRQVPLLCNSTVSSNSSSNATSSFCSTLWDACQDIPIKNSPFSASLQGSAGLPQNSTISKLTDLWQSKSEFCHAFGSVPDENYMCFNGRAVSFDNSETSLPPNGMCLEKIGNGSYINMVSHPDGSNRAFFSSQAGRIFLATVPDQDLGETLGLDESSPFVDLTDQVYLDTSFGMMGMAFHPNFAHNGRFFASFNCDKEKSPACGGRCACNTDVNCDPSKLISSGGRDQPCRYHSVVAEYTANDTGSEPSLATKGKPSEVRRIFTLGLPFTNNHGGQILFGPTDGYLYFMMGDGGGKGDPYNFAQNKKSILGKIIRVDVDNIPSEDEVARLGLWGNYSIPRDNPYLEDKDLVPEIWALGLRNPWRCSFDSKRPSYFLCADVGQDKYEEVNIISKGGNYGWRVYEGSLPFTPQQSPGGNTSADSINAIFSIAGYSHSDVNRQEGSAAISGGYVYRSMTDPCMHGRYLYGDLYARDFWAAKETPEDGGNFTTAKIPFRCARDSPIQCSSVPNSPLPAMGYIFSFGQDNRKDVFILTSTGVYRVVRPSRCNIVCSKENVTAVTNRSPPHAPPPSPPSNGNHLVVPHLNLLLLSSLLLSFALCFLM